MHSPVVRLTCNQQVGDSNSSGGSTLSSEPCTELIRYVYGVLDAVSIAMMITVMPVGRLCDRYSCKWPAAMAPMLMGTFCILMIILAIALLCTLSVKNKIVKK